MSQDMSLQKQVEEVTGKIRKLNNSPTKLLGQVYDTYAFFLLSNNDEETNRRLQKNNEQVKVAPFKNRCKKYEGET